MNPPARQTLVTMIADAGLTVRQAIREKGTPTPNSGLDNSALTDDQLLDAMLAHPILINRPFVVTRWARGCLVRPKLFSTSCPPISFHGPFTKEDGEGILDGEGRRIV